MYMYMTCIIIVIIFNSSRRQTTTPTSTSSHERSRGSRLAVKRVKKMKQSFISDGNEEVSNLQSLSLYNLPLHFFMPA